MGLTLEWIEQRRRRRELNFFRRLLFFLNLEKAKKMAEKFTIQREKETLKKKLFERPDIETCEIFPPIVTKHTDDRYSFKWIERLKMEE